MVTILSGANQKRSKTLQRVNSGQLVGGYSREYSGCVELELNSLPIKLLHMMIYMMMMKLN
jgi:hypothetical protein